MKKYLCAIKIAIWIAAACAMAGAVIYKRTPLVSLESMTATAYGISETLAPGDVAEQRFRPTHKHLLGIDLAIYYGEEVPEETTLVTVEILQGDETLQSQELAVWVFDTLSFLYFNVDQDVDIDRDVVVRVTNTSVEGEQNVFSMMTVDKEYLYLENTQDYTWNGVPQRERFFSRYNYRKGYRYYPGLKYAFWILAAALLITESLDKAPGGSRDNKKD